MKAFVLATILAGAVALLAAPAEAASKKRKAVRSQPVTATTPHPHNVYDHDGELLGRDPDPFIRMMILREGKPRDQGGPH